MEFALLVHPAIAISAVSLVIVAYILKSSRKLYFNAHYAAGILSFALVFIAFPVALYEVAVEGGTSLFPLQTWFHYANFFLAVSFIAVQGGLGIGMLIYGRRRPAYRIHRRLGKYVLVVYLVQGTLGLTVLYGILPYVFFSS